MKVHFAGLQQQAFATMLVKVAGVRYALWTVFPFIADKFGIKSAAWGAAETVPAFLEANCKHVIMDSGLFTLMFGAHAGKRDVKFMAAWMDEMCGFVDRIGYKGCVVEVDCQKVLGVKQAWDFRRKLRDRLPDNEQINVFHAEDGKAGYDALIEWSDYIAISVPELRGMRVPKLPEYVMRQAAYAKNKKPGVKIHLLGCTQASIMERARFCDSCDSTSWQQVVRWGSGKIVKDGKLESFHRSRWDETAASIAPRVTAALAEVGMERSGDDNYSAKMTACSIELLKWYTMKAGSQD